VNWGMFQERLKIKWADYRQIQRVATQVRLTKDYWETKAKDALQDYFDEVEKHVDRSEAGPAAWSPRPGYFLDPAKPL
jgi:hypothetical protein